MKITPPCRWADVSSAAAMLFFALISPLQALTVTTSADENDSPAGANVSLREAIRDTAAGGTVDFDASLAGNTFFLTLGDLSLTKSLTINASGLSDPVHLSQATSQLNISGSVIVNVSNLTFSDGFNVTSGGAVTIASGAIVTFTDCVFANNTSSMNGGAILNNASTLILNSCKLTCNEAPSGSGGAVYGSGFGGVISLSDTVFSGNVCSNSGGAMHSLNSPTVTISNCTFLDNESNFGGAMTQTNGTLTIDGSCIARNKANTAGGGMFLWVNNVATVRNTTIAYNSADGGGGGLALDDDAELTLESCTVVRNQTDARAGGIFVNTACTLNISNCIIAQNQAARSTDMTNNNGTINRSEKNLIGSNDEVETEFPDGSPNANGDEVGTDASLVDPELSLLGYYGGKTMSMHPLAGSPAINGGGTTSLTVDQRGFSRIASAILDLGAVEAGPVFVVTTAVDENDGSLGVGAGNSLRECIAAVTSPGTRIVFSAGVNGTTTTLTNGQITTSDLEVFIDASAMTNGITIDANNASRIFNASTNLADTTLALESLKLVNGSVAAVNASGGTRMTSSNCYFGSNSNSSSGGAIRVITGSHLVVNRSTFEGNTANSIGGGAIYGESDSVMHIYESEFISNSAINGAGESRGGALYSIVAPFHVEDSLFLSNSTTGTSTATGGAIYYTSTLAAIPEKTTMLNCTFSGNISTDLGGAISITGTVGEIVCRHLTITGNSSTLGGGMYIERTGSTKDSLTIDHCIIAENVAPINEDVYYNPIGGSAVMNTSGPNLVGDNSSAAAIFPAGSLVGTFGAEVDPDFGTLGSYGGQTRTINLLAGSPAVDAGSDTDDTPANDQRGYPRIYGSAPDLGAHENGNRYNYALWTSETIPSGDDTSFDGDNEGDSHLHGVEYATGLSPTVTEAGGVLSAELVSDGMGGYVMELTFAYEPTATDLIYTIQRDSDDLVGFVSRYSFNLSTGGEVTPVGANVSATINPSTKTIVVTDGDLSSALNFWQLKVELVP